MWQNTMNKLLKRGLVGCILCCSSWYAIAIDWYVRDWPPFNIQQGPDAGQGSFDLLLTQLIAALPQYQHRQLPSSLVKREQLMQQNAPHCLFGALKSPQRLEKMLFSDVAMYSISLRLVALAEHPLWQVSGADAKIEFSALAQQHWAGMVEHKRTYSHLVQPHTGNLLQVTAVSTDLVAMLKVGRADYVVEYPDRMHWLARQHPDVALRYARIAGEVAVLPVYVACQKSAEAAGQIAAINQALQRLRPNPDYQQAGLSKLSDSSRQELQAILAKDPLFQSKTASQCKGTAC